MRRRDGLRLGCPLRDDTGLGLSFKIVCILFCKHSYKTASNFVGNKGMLKKTSLGTIRGDEVLEIKVPTVT